jgi:hypothetical protein
MKFSLRCLSVDISNKEINDALKNYLRRSIVNRIKYYIGILVLMAVLVLYRNGLDFMIFYNIVYLVTGITGWYVTKRHLWTIDYFIFIFSIQIFFGLTIKRILLDKGSEEEGVDENIIVIVAIFGF